MMMICNCSVEVKPTYEAHVFHTTKTPLTYTQICYKILKQQQEGTNLIDKYV